MKLPTYSNIRVDKKVKIPNKLIPFLTYADKFLQKHDKWIDIKATTFCKSSADDISVAAGYSDGNLAVVAGNVEEYYLVGTLVHEFSHLKQDVRGVFACEVTDPLGKLKRINKNLKPKLNAKKVIKAYSDIFCDTISIEHDCEQETIKLFKKFNLLTEEELNIYIQTANLTLYYFQFLFLTGGSFIDFSLFNDVVGYMPCRLIPLNNFEYIDMNVMSSMGELL